MSGGIRRHGVGVPNDGADATNDARIDAQRHQQMGKRHLFTCDGRVHPWQDSFYTMAWYTSSAAAYDAAASFGPVNPPVSVLNNAGCTTTAGGAATAGNARATPAPAASSSRSSDQSSPSGSDMGLSAALATSAAGTHGAAATATGMASSTVPTASLSLAMSATASETATAGLANFSAGRWDWQAQSASLAAFVTVAAGLIVLGVWAIARRARGVYAPRPVSAGSRPGAAGLMAALTPWSALPGLGGPVGEAQVAAHVGAAALGMAALSCVVGVGVLLPLSVVGVPHLQETGVPNTKGGCFGSLTDLSLLRLLDALDPSPGSPATDAYLGSLSARHLTSTIAPALPSARARLIASLAVSGVLIVGGSVAIIAYTYRKLCAYAAAYDDAREHQDMVFVPASLAPAWKGLTETGVKRRIVAQIYDEDEASVAAVFTIGTVSALNEMVRERAHVLNVLETAEAKYIKIHPTLPPMTSTWTGGAGSRASAISSATSEFVTRPADFCPPAPTGSAFLEVAQRESVHLAAGRFTVGQKVIQDDDGTFLPAPRSDISPSPRSPSLRASHATGMSDWTQASAADVPTNRLAASGVPPELAKIRADITWSRSRLRKLNGDTEKMQQKVVAASAASEGVRGWIIVGKGMRSLPGAIGIVGRTKEDIMWENLGATKSEGKFWRIAFVVMVFAGVLCFPFVGLALASAPGFANQLGGLGWLGDNNSDFATAVVQGFVPAVGITLVLILGLFAINRFARKVYPASYSHLDALSCKAFTYLLLIIGTVWLVGLGAVLFAVPSFIEDVQMTRAVGDGAIYISFLPFVLITNLAIVVPALTLLSPIRLIKWRWQKHKAITPRQKFCLNRPPDFNPTQGLSCALGATFHAVALAGIFPLIAIPALVLTYLSLVLHWWLTSRVFRVSRGGMADGGLAMWTVRRLGWAVALQPLVFGLILLSRREWAIGSAGGGLAVVSLLASELLTVGIHRRPHPSALLHFDYTHRKQVHSEPAQPKHASDDESHRGRLGSDHSILATLHGLLPGLSRLPADQPLPFPTDAVDDMLSTEPAAHGHDTFSSDGHGTLTSGAKCVVVPPAGGDARGLLYPPELLAPAPDVWLPCDRHGVARREADALAAEGLTSVIDPLEDQT